MVVLITGGAGYIGSHTTKYLLERGESVVVLDNLCQGHRDALPWPSVIFVEGDVGDSGLLDIIFESHRPDAVIHFAAHCSVAESVKDPLKYYRNNVAVPLALLETMNRHGCRCLIFSSTAAVYGIPVDLPIEESHPLHPINPYGTSKLMFEKILADCAVSWSLRSVILRYFNASGSDLEGEIEEHHEPETHLIPLILRSALSSHSPITVFGTDYPTEDGTAVRDYVHVEDLARAHYLALRRLREIPDGMGIAPGGEAEVFNLGTGRGYSVKEIISAAEAVTGRTIPVCYGPRRLGDPPSLVCDPRKAIEILGWEPLHKDIEIHISSAWKPLSSRHAEEK